MSIYKKYTFAEADKESIALSQKFLANVPLKLNGNYYNTNNKYVGSCYYGFSSKIFIYNDSATDFDDINFTIVGFHNGKEITEYINGPTAADEVVYTDNVFDYIISITPDDQSGNSTVSVGTGLISKLPVEEGEHYVGYFLPISINTEQHVGVLAYSVQVIGKENEVAFTIYGSLEDIINNGKTFDEMIEEGVLLDVVEEENPIEFGIYSFAEVYKTIVVQIRNIDANIEDLSGKLIFRQL